MQDHITKTSVIRYLLLCACVVGLYYVITSETVAEAILNFCFAGVIPGTNRSLAPDTVMIGVASLAGLLMLAIAVRIVWRLLRSRQRSIVAPQVDADGHTVMFSRQATSAPVKKQPKAHVVHKSRQNRASATAATAEHTVMAWFSSGIRRLLTSGGAALVLIRGWAVRVLRAVPPALEWLGLAVFAAAGKCADVGRRAGGTAKCYATIAAGHIYIAARYTRAQTIIFLRWLEPYARRFDTWLEIKCRQLISIINGRMSRFETVQLARTMMVDAKKSLKRPGK